MALRLSFYLIGFDSIANGVGLACHCWPTLSTLILERLAATTSPVDLSTTISTALEKERARPRIRRLAAAAPPPIVDDITPSNAHKSVDQKYFFQPNTEGTAIQKIAPILLLGPFVVRLSHSCLFVLIHVQFNWSSVSSTCRCVSQPAT